MTEPDVALPVANPEPVQDDAFADDHVRVDAPPEPTEVGDAERDAVGVAAGFTVTVCVPEVVPPEPVQETV